ncbi:NADH-quinone oxidoreductase subunit N (NADH dehydrogenase I subunit N) (NDH-1 subunit N) [Durusdinium trenchii]|uniref:NADH-quinone oxidoreductase subunit N (NADH dehydrogenase I subunit N) (NDH-1 subunit N) n=1 Tax=Durusdinium trenchii TaxID=1381693 RepID=A0ABP0RN63_9DINO
MAFQGSAEVLHELSLFFGIALGVCAAASMTFGNLAAYTQDNVKRLLAYSTIAHAGYMLMAISALLVILSNPVSAEDAQYASAALCVEGLMYYIAVYLFMNLAAFAVVALVRNETYREDIEGFNGLISCNTPTKVLCICMAFSFFSLVGMPPFGGFFAKMLIFYGAFQAGTVHWFLWALLAIGGVNTVFSLFYYLRVLKAMFIAPRAEESRPVETPAMVSAYVVLLTIPLLALGASPLQQDLSATARNGPPPPAARSLDCGARCGTFSMNQTDSNARINALLVQLNRSLVQYVHEADTYANGASQGLLDLVESIATRQREDVARLVGLLDERNHAINFGVFPVDYTSLHYVAVSYLLDRLIAAQQSLVDEFEKAKTELSNDPAAATVIAEIAQAEQSALEKLKEGKQPTPAATA